MMLTFALAVITSSAFTIVDGDTIKLDGQRYRLAGIDAAESRQECLDAAGKSYPAGTEATNRLSFLMKGEQVTCTWDKPDPYGRPIATCDVLGDAKSLNEHMVEEGFAFAAYSPAYFGDELEARLSHIGIWQGSCEAPAQWRKEHRIGRQR